VEKITSGDLEYRITVYTKDEVGLLALAFNKMVEELQKSIIRLKQEIDERKKAEKALAEQLRLEALGSSIGVALASASSLQEMLQLCSEEFVWHIGVAFARIWIMDQDHDELVLQASAGMYTHLDGAHSRIPVGSMKIGHIALTREPHLTNDVLSDPQISNQEWARKEGMVAFAGYPLMIDDRVVGVMAMFSREVLTDSALRLLESVAVRIAIGIERKKAEKELVESEERYKNIFQNSRAVMLLVDPKTSAIIDANPAALTFYGYSYEQFLNMKIMDMNTLSSEKIAEEMEKAKKGERNYFIFPHRLSSGQVKTVEVYSGPVVMKGRQLLFSIIHDISKRVIVEKEREKLTKELEQIVHATSHDLRSPMLNVHGYSHIMSESVEKCRSLIHRKDVPEDIQTKLQGILEEHIVEPARYIDKSIKQMDSMLSGLLKLSRSGRIELNIKDLDMNQLLRDVIVNFELHIKKKGIKLHLSELPPCRGDEGQIGQVFLNLIGNAIKYLTAGRPGIIHISGKNKEGMATYCVEDNGSGIAPEDRDRIFTIFQQVDRSFGGEGIGLTIVKKTIERHGGSIWVESEIGKGTKFYVSLPTYGNE
jgi:PAS domain S-box-containing protein